MKTRKFKVGLGLLCALLALAVLRAAVRPAIPVRRPSDYRDADVILSRAGASGWKLTTREGGAASSPPLYAPSLYAPRLREWVSHEPAGTAIGLHTSPAAIPLAHNSPSEREIRDFGIFCEAHGVYFFPLPVS